MKLLYESARKYAHEYRGCIRQRARCARRWFVVKNCLTTSSNSIFEIFAFKYSDSVRQYARPLEPSSARSCVLISSGVRISRIWDVSEKTRCEAPAAIFRPLL